MVDWIYILKCINKNGIECFYVGKTTKLYTRYNQHLSGKGGANTSSYSDIKILTLYKQDTINLFKEYEDLDAENYITECFMSQSKKWKNIRGGIYVQDKIYKRPTKKFKLPWCNCELPCNIKYEENKKIFICSKKNIWPSMINKYNISNVPCEFYKEE